MVRPGNAVTACVSGRGGAEADGASENAGTGTGLATAGCGAARSRLGRASAWRAGCSWWGAGMGVSAAEIDSVRRGGRRSRRFNRAARRVGQPGAREGSGSAVREAVATPGRGASPRVSAGNGSSLTGMDRERGGTDRSRMTARDAGAGGSGSTKGIPARRAKRCAGGGAGRSGTVVPRAAGDEEETGGRRAGAGRARSRSSTGEAACPFRLSGTASSESRRLNSASVCKASASGLTERAETIGRVFRPGATRPGRVASSGAVRAGWGRGRGETGGTAGRAGLL